MSPRALAERHRAWAKGLLANHCFVNAMIGIFPSSNTERRGLSDHLRSSLATRSDLRIFRSSGP
jgi:hypothetical protein